MNKSTITYKVEISHDKCETKAVEMLNGNTKKSPIYIGGNDPFSVAQACRAIAYQLLERADGIQYGREFYHTPDIKEQIELMIIENKLEFSEETK